MELVQRLCFHVASGNATAESTHRLKWVNTMAGCNPQGQIYAVATSYAAAQAVHVHAVVIREVQCVAFHAAGQSSRAPPFV